MATNANEVLRQFITSAQQRPEWGPDRVQRDMVIYHFTTPSGFNGQGKMTLAEWSNPEVRNDKIFSAIAVLEGPFWEEPEQAKKGK